MEEIIGSLRAAETWIYLLLGLGSIFFIRKFFLAWQELRGAVFGLEREKAQARLSQVTSILVVILSLAIAEFILVSFVAPTVSKTTPLFTPTLNLLVTPTLTIEASILQTESLQGTLQPPLLGQSSNGCIPGQIEITFPADGQEVNGVVEVKGTANIPNFGFYKFEIKRPDDTIWLTIQAGNTVVQSGKLGDWDTSQLTPGEYLLGLVVVDNQAQASPPCAILVRVIPTPEPTKGP